MYDHFAPLNAEGTERLEFSTSDVTILHGDLWVRGPGPKAVVEIDGQHFVVVGRECTIEGCNCDAFIMAIRPDQVDGAVQLVDRNDP